MIPMDVTAWYGPVHVTLRHGTNPYHTMAWYQCKSHYSMVHYGMIPMHVTLWHGTNMSHYGMIPMHVTL